MAYEHKNRWQACRLAALVAILLFGTGPAAAQPAGETEFFWLDTALQRGRRFCMGKCAVHVFGGAATATSMTAMFALDDTATFAPGKFVPPWEWEFTGSGLVAGAVSYRLLTIANVIDFEGEAGIGQRFGTMHETEIWAALYARWIWFPWNHLLRTSLATSTGLSLASGVPWAERERDSRRRGSKLLHYFSPEITLGLPSRPEWELVARIHHRSGARILFGDLDLFNGVGGGVQFATLGLRYRF
jgi:hypothetical protein